NQRTDIASDSYRFRLWRVVMTPAVIAVTPASRATISGRGRSFSAAMTMAIPTITSGFIIPSTTRTSVGAEQQRQQAAPCLQPSRKFVSFSAQAETQPDRERQPSKPVIFQRVN